jgi:glycosyltransferase involved in cell wall biosynthesis
MKILFICGSAEPGKDGVGDYTRRLCGKLTRLGHQARILSLCDHQAISFIDDTQMVEETTVIVNRISTSISNKQRFILSQDIINKFQPDWISLQFVPYSFNPRGLPFWLPSFLKKLTGNHKWHIMFHELWIGMDSDATFKSKCIGLLQKKIVLKILKGNENIIINTQTDLYQSKIEALGYNAQILPLFSNIVKNAESKIETTIDKEELRFCVFGSIHYGAPVEKFINELKLLMSTSNEKRSLKFVFIGNCGVAIEEWKKVLLENKINFEITGFVIDEEINILLSGCQYGISTTPYILNQKSGSLAAMFDHQLPVLCIARNWTVNGFNQGRFLNLENYENKETIKEFVNRKFIPSNENNLEFVALKFLKGLK